MTSNHSDPVQSPVDVTRLLDERGMSRFNIGLVAFMFLIVLFAGYNISVMGFAAPLLIKTWHIGNQASLAKVLGASVVGMLFGSPIFGYLGDRFGRRRAIILSIILFCAFTWVTVFATTLNQIMVLRLLAGIGLGGILPNVVALVAEFAPRRYCATMIIVMMTGIAFGAGLPGPVAAGLAPRFGWTVLFTVGGGVSFLVALACIIWLPESIKYLVIKEDRRKDAIRLLARLRPDMTFGPETTFSISNERQQVASPSPKHLFRGGLAWITILLWLIFVCNLMGYMFLLSWTPVLLSTLALPMAKIAIANSMFFLGGGIGGLILARPMDRLGLTLMKILFAVSVPVVALIGVLGSISEPLLMIIQFLAGFCVLCTQYALNVASALFYPTSLRSVGSGLAFGVGRLGSVFGPVLGGVLIGMHLGVRPLYTMAAIPFLVGTIACFILARIYAARSQESAFGMAQVRTKTSGA